MTKDELDLLSSVIGHAKNGAAAATKLAKLIESGWALENVPAIKIEGDPLKPGEERTDEVGRTRRRLGGDAGKAYNDFFRVHITERKGETRIEIECPTFLRGPLKIKVPGAAENVHGGY